MFNISPDTTDDSFPAELKEKNGIYCKGKDINGHKISKSHTWHSFTCSHEQCHTKCLLGGMLKDNKDNKEN